MPTAVHIPPARSHHVVSVQPVPVALDWSIDGGVMEVSVCGELCAWSTPMWQRSVELLVETSNVHAVVLTLVDVTLFDASAVSALLRLRAWSGDRGIAFTTGGLNPAVERVIAIAGLSWVIGSDGPQGSA